MPFLSDLQQQFGSLIGGAQSALGNLVQKVRQIPQGFAPQLPLKVDLSQIPQQVIQRVQQIIPKVQLPPQLTQPLIRLPQPTPQPRYVPPGIDQPIPTPEPEPLDVMPGIQIPFQGPNFQVPFEDIKTLPGRLVQLSSQIVSDFAQRVPSFQERIIEPIKREVGQFAEFAQSKGERAERFRQMPIAQITPGELALSFSPGGITEVIPRLTPVQKIINALLQAKSLRGQQETLYSMGRAAQVARGKAAQVGTTGETGFFKELGALKGELPKAQFESIRSQFTQQDITSLFNQIRDHPNLQYFETIQAREGLAKLLGERGGGIPQESQIKLLDQVFGPEFTKAVLKNRDTWNKILSGAEEIINVPRALMASMDLSAPLRQGLPLITRGEFWRSLGPMVKSFFSEKVFQNIMDDISSRPTYQAMQDAKLQLTNLGSSLGPREEFFLTNLAEKIPLIGKGVRASNRAYVAFLNKLRADTFDSMVRLGERNGVLNPDYLKSVASFVNTATGRGDLPQVISRMAPLLNGTFFSPRLIASRLQLLNPQFYIKQDPLVRKELVKSILGATGVVLTTLGLAKLAGAQVGNDPRNADFAKIRVGNTRYDTTGGFAAYFRLAAQMITGQLVSSTTGKVSRVGEGFKSLTRADILYRFAQNKYAPIVSLISSLMQGQGPLGEPLNFTEKNAFQNPIGRILIPMLAQDFADAYEEWGAAGTALALPSALGVGVQTYNYTLPEKLKVQTEGMTREQRKAFIEQARQLAVAKAEGQDIADQRNQGRDDVIKSLSGMDEITRAKNLQYIKETNPQLFKMITQQAKESARNQQLGLTPFDQALKQAPIISRVQYIVNQGRNMDINQRALFLQDLKNKGILTKEVIQQLQVQP